MIIGLGSDLCNIERIQASLDRFGERFEQRVFTEVERAKGVAEANRIVADGLGGPEGYLRYLYIEHLAQSQGQIIYVPTEGGLPILEAGRLRQRPAPKPEE